MSIHIDIKQKLYWINRCKDYKIHLNDSCVAWTQTFGQESAAEYEAFVSRWRFKLEHCAATNGTGGGAFVWGWFCARKPRAVWASNAGLLRLARHAPPQQSSMNDADDISHRHYESSAFITPYNFFSVHTPEWNFIVLCVHSANYVALSFEISRMIVFDPVSREYICVDICALCYLTNDKLFILLLFLTILWLDFVILCS